MTSPPLTSLATGKMQKLKIIYGVLLLSSSLGFLTEAFIVPQEIPSLLSLVYSNIPPIKKGTDSRIGFGYRFGDHADFQVQFEIGPQKETQPIGVSVSNPSKRNIRPANDFQLERTVRKDKIKQQQFATPNVSSWLQNWFTQFTKSFETTTRAPTPKLIRAPTISPSAIAQLSLLYQKSGTVNTEEETSESTEIDSNEPTGVITTTTTTTTEQSLNHHLPPAAIAILRESRSQQQQRSKEKIDSITRDLANVELD